MEDLPVYPKAAIRRFDVFAEYNKIEQMNQGEPEDNAEGYGIWIAKVVASRKYGKKPPEPKKVVEAPEKRVPEEERKEDKWRTLDGKPQTDELFEKEIVERMGREFYEKVFEPAIREAVDKGKSYQSIRDNIRIGWKPKR